VSGLSQTQRAVTAAVAAAAVAFGIAFAVGHSTRDEGPAAEPVASGSAPNLETVSRDRVAIVAVAHLPELPALRPPPPPPKPRVVTPSPSSPQPTPATPSPPTPTPQPPVVVEE
jgi:hypothetical protein